MIVADGLRADSLYNSHRNEAPYLTGKIKSSLGAWGVSHTRVPTESRPGHVAIMAGIFEDPSAITRGWQENPVDFDTVFNQSDAVWSWGSPDILPMFAKGVWKDQVRTFMYEPQLEDFSHSDPSQLDTWVFDRVAGFFRQAGTNASLRQDLRGDKIILFLHLLGLDTNGHTNKPHSHQYAHNVHVVDEGVQKVVQMAEQHWRHDGRTAYLFTADHGMTDWGSHGAGMDHETQTPFLAWGAGLPKVNNEMQRDLNQTDIAPLMAALLGTYMPQHSVGKLPMSYLDGWHDSHKVSAKLANALQIHEQFKSFQAGFQKSLLHTPFEGLDDTSFQLLHDKIHRLTLKARYKEALLLADQLYDKSLTGLFYYQRYHRFSLYLTTSLSYVGFIIYLTLIIVKQFTVVTMPKELETSHKYLLMGLALCGSIVSLLATAALNVPFHYLNYYLALLAVWLACLKEYLSLQLSPSHDANDWKPMLVSSMIVLAIIEALVATFFDRRFLIVAILITMFWQLRKNWRVHKTLNLLWAFLCTCLCLFSLQPSVGKERRPLLVVLAGLLSFSAVMIGYYKKGLFKKNAFQDFSIVTNGLYLCLSGTCVYISSSSSSGFSVTLSRVLAWIILATGTPLALLTPSKLLPRLLALCMSLEASYLLLSLTYEGLFLICLVATMFVWLMIEHRKSFAYQDLASTPVLSCPRQRHVLNYDDLQRSLSFLLFTILSFFGTGNIASLNSFDPKSIQSLVAVFNPFLMGGLLLLKILIPFLVVACFAFSVQYVTQMPRRALFLMVLLFSDFMGLHFFFFVTDQGSWQEIGTSLSHFVIVEATVIVLQVLFQLAKFLLVINIGPKSDKEDVQVLVQNKY